MFSFSHKPMDTGRTTRTVVKEPVAVPVGDWIDSSNYINGSDGENTGILVDSLSTNSFIHKHNYTQWHFPPQHSLYIGVNELVLNSFTS